MAASVLDLVPIIHNILCEVESRSEEDRKVAVLHYLNNLSSSYSGFENTCIFQRLLTLVDSENFGGNIVDVSSIIRTEISGELLAISDDVLLNTKISINPDKPNRSSNSFSVFNFDDFPPFESLEEVLREISQSITSAAAWERLLNFDYLDLLEHPQWYSVIDVLDRALNHKLVIKDKVLLTIYASCFRFLQAFGEHPQCGDIINLLTTHLLQEWISDNASKEGKGDIFNTILNNSKKNGLWVGAKESLSQIARGRLTLFDLLLRTFVSSKNCLGNDMNHYLSSSFVWLLSYGSMKIDDVVCPILFILVGNHRFLDSLTTFLKLCDPFALFLQNYYCHFSSILTEYLNEAIRFGQQVEVPLRADFHLLSLGITELLLIILGIFRGCNPEGKLWLDQGTVHLAASNFTSLHIQRTNKKVSILISANDFGNTEACAQRLSDYWSDYLQYRSNRKVSTDTFHVWYQILSQLHLFAKHCTMDELCFNASNHWIRIVNEVCNFYKNSDLNYCLPGDSANSDVTKILQVLIDTILLFGDRSCEDGEEGYLFQKGLCAITALLSSGALNSNVAILKSNPLGEGFRRLYDMSSRKLSIGQEPQVVFRLYQCVFHIFFNETGSSSEVFRSTIVNMRPILKHQLIFSPHTTNNHPDQNYSANVVEAISCICESRLNICPSEIDATIMSLICSKVACLGVMLNQASCSKVITMFLLRLSRDPYAFENQYDFCSDTNDRSFQLMMFECAFKLTSLFPSILSTIEFDEYLEGYHERLFYRPKSIFLEMSKNDIAGIISRSERSTIRRINHDTDISHCGFLDEDTIRSFSSCNGRSNAHVSFRNESNALGELDIIRESLKALPDLVIGQASMLHIELRHLMIFVLHSWFSPHIEGDDAVEIVGNWTRNRFDKAMVLSRLVEVTCKVVEFSTLHSLVGFEKVLHGQN